MPKGTKSMQLGGQRRTVVCGCGYFVQGHPTQINLRLRLHQKVCEYVETDICLPAYNSKQAQRNGWRGCSNGSQHNMTANIFADNEMIGEVEVNTAYELLETNKIE